jgi:hypothetical protein
MHYIHQQMRTSDAHSRVENVFVDNIDNVPVFLDLYHKTIHIAHRRGKYERIDVHVCVLSVYEYVVYLWSG